MDRDVFWENTDLAWLMPLTGPWPLAWVRRWTGAVWLPSIEPVALASASFPPAPVFSFWLLETSSVGWRISAAVIQCPFSVWFWMVQWRMEGKGTAQGASQASSPRWDSDCSLQGNNQSWNVVFIRPLILYFIRLFPAAASQHQTPARVMRQTTVANFCFR